MSLSHKPPEFWIALGAGVLFVLLNNPEKSLWKRAAIAAMSGGLGFALAPDVAVWTGRSEALCAMALTALGYMALDLVASLIADRTLIKDVIRRRSGSDGDKP